MLVRVYLTDSGTLSYTFSPLAVMISALSVCTKCCFALMLSSVIHRDQMRLLLDLMQPSAGIRDGLRSNNP